MIELVSDIIIIKVTALKNKKEKKNCAFRWIHENSFIIDSQVITIKITRKYCDVLIKFRIYGFFLRNIDKRCQNI